jgi:uridine kinase
VKKTIRFEDLVELVLNRAEIGGKARNLVLIGGCSRVGKSWLVCRLKEELCRHRIDCLSICLDAWIVSNEKRKTSSTVVERYESGRAVAAIDSILHGEIVSIPVYDSVKRMRVSEDGEIIRPLKSGIILVEGVVALAINKLADAADVKIYVAIDDDLRKRRLLEFYREFKGFTQEAANQIIGEREAEEVAFVKSTSLRADLIFEGSNEKDC